LFICTKKGFTMVWRNDWGYHWGCNRGSGGWIMDDYLVVSLLRHGMTKENENRAYIGSSDPPLHNRGRKEVFQKRLQMPNVQLVFSSNLKRCLETAEILFPTSPIHVVEELREINFGCFEGKTYEDLKDNQMYRDWINDMFTTRPENGESYAKFS